MNIRTYHKLCMSGMIGFVLMILGMVGRGHAVVTLLQSLALLWVICMGVMGAITAILLMKGKLRLGCPRCERMCKVNHAGYQVLEMNCEKCGRLVVLFKMLGLEVLDRDETRKRQVEERKLRRKSGKKVRLLEIPIRYPKAFAAMFLPVVLSIIIGSIIYQFMFFYLIIPGVWCYIIASVLIQAVAMGEIDWKTGTMYRSQKPIRFWLSLLIWMPFYVMSAYMPIGMGLQESGKSLQDYLPADQPPYEDVREFETK